MAAMLSATRFDALGNWPSLHCGNGVTNLYQSDGGRNKADPGHAHRSGLAWMR